MRIERCQYVLSEGTVIPIDPADPRAQTSLAILQEVWPVGYDEVQQTVTGWYPVVAVQDFVRGHHSGAAPSPDGWVYASVNDPVGGAEGLLHEMGHLKLKRMGVYYESWTRVLANRPDELFVSPIRKDRLRPMGAVLHALYSYLYVTQFDVYAYAAGVLDAESLRINRARIAEGTAVLEAHVRPTPDGQEFINSVLRWGHDLSI